jgi:hypothetical protein
VVCKGSAVTDAANPRTARSVYRIRRAYFVRALGRSAVVAAVLMLLSTVAFGVELPGFINSVLVVLTAVALVVVAVISVSVMLPPTLMQLDADGFRLSKRHTSGPHQAHWADVRAVASQQGPQGWVLLLQHESGEHTAVPLELADVDAVTIERDVRDRLNEAHGYRPMS